jgi:hypothetical protein
MTHPTSAFTSMVPGFDFLQGLVKNAGAAMPGVGQWIAPTIDPEELEKRIQELRTVQFWLEQNAKLLGATIQALEVQRMTLSTLKTMNVSLGDLTESLKIHLPEAAPPADDAVAPPAPAPSYFRSAPPPAPATAAAPAPEPAPGLSVPTGVVDPMQWWGALTQQFTQLAASAMKDTANDGTRHLAGAMVKQGLDAASETFRQAAAKTTGQAPARAAAKRKPAAKAPRAGKAR